MAQKILVNLQAHVYVETEDAEHAMDAVEKGEAMVPVGFLLWCETHERPSRVIGGNLIRFARENASGDEPKQWMYRDCIMGFVSSKTSGLEFRCSDKCDGDDCEERVLKRFGDEGWELCAVRYVETGISVFYFKKEKV